jgi:hypothetical protein
VAISLLARLPLSSGPGMCSVQPFDISSRPPTSFGAWLSTVPSVTGPATAAPSAAAISAVGIGGRIDSGSRGSPM